MTIRQFCDLANTAIGGGATSISIVDISAQLQLINGEFEGGFNSGYGGLHLSSPGSTVPESAAWAMF